MFFFLSILKLTSFREMIIFINEELIYGVKSVTYFCAVSCVIIGREKISLDSIDNCLISVLRWVFLEILEVTFSVVMFISILNEFLLVSTDLLIFCKLCKLQTFTSSTAQHNTLYHLAHFISTNNNSS